MKHTTKIDVTHIYEKTLVNPRNNLYSLRLYITGTTPQSIRAITNLKKICHEYLKDRYELEIIDIYQQPLLAERDQIIAAPTLIKKSPLPFKRLIGDMSNTERVLKGLDIRTKDGI